MAKVLIRDGYTREATFPARHGIHAVQFKYRPALPERAYGYLRASKANGPDQMREASNLLAEHLVGWDIDGDGDAPAPLVAASFKRLPLPLLDFMVDCVTGYGPDEAARDAGN